MSDETLKLDPRLNALHQTLTTRLYGEKIEPLMKTQGLLDAEGEQPQLPLTEGGFDLLLKNLVISMAVALSRAKIEITVDYSFDEVELGENVLNEFGAAALSIQENDLHLTFNGKGALIKSMTVPMDIEKALASRPKGDHVNVQIGLKPRFTGRGIVDIGKPVGEIL